MNAVRNGGKMKHIAILASLLLSTQDAVAGSEYGMVGKCFAALAAGDRIIYQGVAEEISAWDGVDKPTLRKTVKLCLELGQEETWWEPQGFDAPKTSRPPENHGSSFLETLYSDIEAGKKTVPDAIALVLEKHPDHVGTEEASARVENAILAFVKPIPAAQVERNLTAYKALAILRPENEAYAAKVQHYEEALARMEVERETRANAIVRSLRKNTVEFDGSAWYRHPDSPRYQDIRPYLTLYILESGTGDRELEFFINYTSDRWLFVQSAQLNIDGELVKLPYEPWAMDNDTEIWEWNGYIATPELIETARKIANSGRTVIRFDGQDFFDDYVLPQSDKNVIRDMLDAWAVMGPE